MNWNRDGCGDVSARGWVVLNFGMHCEQGFMGFQLLRLYLSSAITEGWIARLHAGNEASLGLVVSTVAIRVACKGGKGIC